MIKRNEDKHTHIYLLVLEADLSIFAPLMVMYIRDSLHDVLNMKIFVVLEVFVKLRRFCQPYDNFGEKQKFYLADPRIFRREAGNSGSQFCHFFNKMTVKLS
jgi:hypothetical protein